jgi:hypothetical protein
VAVSSLFTIRSFVLPPKKSSPRPCSKSSAARAKFLFSRCCAQFFYSPSERSAWALVVSPARSPGRISIFAVLSRSDHRVWIVFRRCAPTTSWDPFSARQSTHGVGFGVDYSGGLVSPLALPTSSSRCGVWLRYAVFLLKATG